LSDPSFMPGNQFKFGHITANSADKGHLV